MSLAIDPNEVTAVLLADGWHEVQVLGDNSWSSFDLDSYEYVDAQSDPDRDPIVLVGGGQSGICSVGFTFRELVDENGTRRYCTVMGPLTSILAVRTR